MHKIVFSGFRFCSFLIKVSVKLPVGLDRWRRPADQPARLRRDAVTPVAKLYDGGQPSNAPDLKGKKITVVDVPKLVGIGYFQRHVEGTLTPPRKWATWTPRPTDRPRPTSTTVITLIDNYITSGVNGILFGGQ